MPSLIAYPDRTLTAALSGGSWQSGFPLANLQDRMMSRRSRSANALASSSVLATDIGGAYPNRVFALLKHNCSITATVRIRGCNDSGHTAVVHDSGYINIWPQTLTAADISGYPNHFFHIFPANVYARYWLIEIADTGNADGFVELGRCWLGPAFETGIAQDATLGYESLTVTDTSLGGVPWDNRREPRRRCAYTLPTVDASGRNGMLLMQRNLETSGEFLFVLDSDAIGADMMLQSYPAKHEKLDPLKYPYATCFEASGEAVEILDGTGIASVLAPSGLFSQIGYANNQSDENALIAAGYTFWLRLDAMSGGTTTTTTGGGTTTTTTAAPVTTTTTTTGAGTTTTTTAPTTTTTTAAPTTTTTGGGTTTTTTTGGGTTTTTTAAPTTTTTTTTTTSAPATPPVPDTFYASGAVANNANGSISGVSTGGAGRLLAVIIARAASNSNTAIAQSASVTASGVTFTLKSVQAVLDSQGYPQGMVELWTGTAASQLSSVTVAQTGASTANQGPGRMWVATFSGASGVNVPSGNPGVFGDLDNPTQTYAAYSITPVQTNSLLYFAGIDVNALGARTILTGQTLLNGASDSANYYAWIQSKDAATSSLSAVSMGTSAPNGYGQMLAFEVKH